MDERLEQLERWLESVLGTSGFVITPASTDASFRRYFRVTYDDISRIAMDAPPEKEDCRPYIKAAQAFLSLGLNVPHIFESDLERGFILLSDMGVRSYLEVLNETNVVQLYGDATEALMTLHTHKETRADIFPPYDQTLLMNEMELFREWYLEKRLGLTLHRQQQRVLDDTYKILTVAALEQPRVWVHRDYHSRNLMVVEDNNPGILDFQDAVIGPITYDLVSLLRDCYVRWPDDRVETWAGEYYLRLKDAGVINGIGGSQFMRWFDLMGIQRHLKATGIFSRLCIRDGKSGYLQDIPRTLGYVSEISARYPELRGLSRMLAEIA